MRTLTLVKTCWRLKCGTRLCGWPASVSFGTFLRQRQFSSSDWSRRVSCCGLYWARHCNSLYFGRRELRLHAAMGITFCYLCDNYLTRNVGAFRACDAKRSRREFARRFTLVMRPMKRVICQVRPLVFKRSLARHQLYIALLL